MLSWFPSQVKEHGLLQATGLLVRVMRYRIPVVVSNKLLSPTQECPCCGWQGRSFLDYIEVGYRVPKAACPRCDSHSRHRALYLWLRNEFQVDKRQGTALVFAPEAALAPLWDHANGLRVIKTDIVPARGVDVLSDITHLPFVAESVDFIWCHHVLEQVADDRQAMEELYRILDTAGGVAIISVGLTKREKTEEFQEANKKLSGNRRMYGADFIERLLEVGFDVKPMEYGLSEAEMRCYSVYPETFYYCTKPR
jgi:SAM-dependent methyltransferase